MSLPAKVWVTVVKNPFDPHRSKLQQWFDHVPGMTAYDCVKSFYPLVGEDLDVEISINGRLLAAEEIKTLAVEPGCNVVFCAVPHGGGGSTKIVRTIAMIAVMVIAAVVTRNPAVVAAVGQWGAAAAGTAVAVGGSLLVNAILPVPTPDFQGIGGDLEAHSPTYSWGAQPNVYLEGSRWPVLYGSRRVTPPILAKHITQRAVYTDDGDDSVRQYIHVLMAVADHAVDSITDIEINGSPIANFEGASYETKLGAIDQTSITEFDWQRQQTSVNQEVSPSTEYTGQTTGNAVTGIEVGLLLPGGLFWAREDGTLSPIYYQWTLYYRLTGAPAWTTWKTVTLNKNTRKAVRAYARKSDLAAGQYDIKVVVITAPPVSTRYSPRESYVEFVGEIIQEDFTYPGASLLAVKALATGQLSGSQPTITCIATRSTVSTSAGNKPANLPAWAAYDLHCNEEYGERIPTSEMIIADFTTWATFCSTNGLYCNIYIDSKGSLAEMCAHFEQIGRGRVVERGTRYSTIIDRVASPVQLFGIGNIVENSFEMSYIDSADQANIVQVAFFDEDNDYIKRTAQVVVPGFDPTTDEANIAQLTLYGCTDADIALKHAKYILNGNTLQVRTVSFEAGFDAIACAAGDVISVSYDAVSWGQSGRVVSTIIDAGTISVTNASASVTGSGTSWTAALVGGVLTVAAVDYTVHSVESTTALTLTAIYAGTTATGLTYQIAIDSTTNSVTLDRTVDLVAGTAYKVVVQHQATDIIEEATLAAVVANVTTDELTITGTWTANPTPGAVISVGVAATITKPFRVTRITRASDQRRKIQALEYNASVYVDTVVAEPWVAPEVLAPVVNLVAREIREIIDGQYKVSVNLSWRGWAWKWRVYYRRNGDNDWILVGDTALPQFAISGLIPGYSYDFCVTDVWHGPTHGLQIIGFEVTGWADMSLPIFAVTGLQISESGNASLWYGRDLKLTWNVVAEFFPVTADGDPGGASTYSTAESSLVYRVRISTGTGSLLRETIIAEAHYTYTFENNYHDNGGSPSPTLSVSVWARNSAGMESSVPATLYVTNPAPAAVTGLQALAYMGGVKCYWNANSDPDIAGYQVRYQISTSDQEMDDWAGVTWLDVDGTEFVATLTNLQRVNNTDTIYFQVRARDTFGQYSAIVEDEATADDFFIVEGALSEALQTKINADAEMASEVALLENQWTLKIQEDGYATGMGAILHYLWSATEIYLAGDYVAISTGAVYIALRQSLGAEPTASALDWEVVPYGARSEIIFLVDKFAIINPASGDGVKRAPFVVGNVGGTATVGINGALVVDGTLTADAIAANSLTASHIKGDAFGALTISSGSITISTTDGLDIAAGGSMSVNGMVKIIEGADLRLYSTALANASQRFYYGTTKYADIFLWGANGIKITPYANDAIDFYIGDSVYGWDYIFLHSAGQIQLHAADAIRCYNTLLGTPNKTVDLGTSAIAWDNVYGDDFINVADLLHMDIRIENGVEVAIDDLEVISSIKASDEYDPITGLRLINDSTLPTWLVHKHKSDGELRDEGGDIIQTWKAGDVAYGPDGRPYLSLLTMISLVMGAARQLDSGIKTIEKILTENKLTEIAR